MLRLRTLRHFAVLLLVLLVAATIAPKVAHAQLLPSFGRDRAGTSGFQFLKIPVDRINLYLY